MCNQETLVYNKSSYQLSQAEYDFLKKGLKHGLHQQRLPLVDIVHDLEIAATYIPPEKQKKF